jgi:hypothetical protein
MKQTIEEAAKRLYPRLINDPYNPMEDDNKEDRDIWINGAKWATETLYSEEDMKKCWNAAYIDALAIDEETYKPLFFEDFIKQHKKK